MTTKTAYIRGFFGAIALFGLMGCARNANSSANKTGNASYLGEGSKMAVGKTSISTAESGKTIGDIYRDAVPMFQDTMVNCSDKIWPGYSWRNFSVLMLEQGKQILEWDGATGVTKLVDEHSLPDVAYSGLYSFWDWEGHTSVSLNITGDQYYSNSLNVFQLATHEGFHQLGQASWKNPEGKRGTVFPVESLPRLYRRGLFDSLNKYFQSGGQDTSALKQASYWYNKWKSEYPNEAASTTDGYEGTARYVEYLATIVAQKGCNASEADLLKGTQELIEPSLMKYFVDASTFSLDGEGYAIGAMAAFILRLINHDPTWYSQMATAKTPVDVLLENVPQEKAAIDPTLSKEFNEQKDKKNDEIYKMIGDDYKNYGSTEYVRVGLTGDFSSFSPKDFLLSAGSPELTIIPMAEDIVMIGTASSLTLKANTVAFEIQLSPCGGSYFHVLLPKSEMNVVNGELLFKGGRLEGKLPGEMIVDKNGYSWFCGTK